MPLDVLIVRDPRESVRKCSLTPLRGHPGIRFHTYREDRIVEAGARVLLHPEGEELGPSDLHAPLLLVDCSWRRVPTLLRTVRGELRPRRLPLLETAYPRRSKTFEDPDSGLASIEALYAALALTGHAAPSLLERYLFAARFLELNPHLPRPGPSSQEAASLG
jgi:pre-rRNA-processing protein TSR3